MGRWLSVAVGPPLALVVAITLIETDVMEVGAFLLAPILGGFATFLLVPQEYRRGSEAVALGLVSLVLAFAVTSFGTLLWLVQYIPD